MTTNLTHLVLKGGPSFLFAPNSPITVMGQGSPGMATAGSGDVLTGMITAFLGVGLATFEAARWAVELHGKAGDRAARRKSKTSLIATDIIENIPFVLRS